MQFPKIGTLWIALHLAKAVPKWSDVIFITLTDFKMDLVAKRNHILTLKRSEQGQISIFFSASLVVFISIIAFVINVGLFVKAKINLQNATDASAFAGAAVQARQLTKIAYLNWEMRNIYKEWMYKYYVIGSLNTPGVEDPTKSTDCPGGKCTDFRLASDVDALDPNSVTKDAYNFPAVCIHIAGSKTNVCKRFAVPGLPEFGGSSMPGPEEASRMFFDELIATKIDDCAARSNLNMLVTTMWAYNIIPSDNTGSNDNLVQQSPGILTDRQGAWPKAMEVAMRIRNLEKVVNRKARSESVCIGGTGSCTPIDQIASENHLGDERIVKAFYSGYRNLGNEIDFEVKNSFRLTELPPTPQPIESGSNSNLLIPSSKLYEKQYVDLKLMMVNLATFYAALIPRADKGKSGACNISKVAIPVPGYPLGYYKNPDVVTYYAVKGEAEFEGMFNPFSSENIKLTAYAAAKPAGGRIGPMLFTQVKGQEYIVARTEPSKFRSVPYVSSLDVSGTKNRYLADGVLDEGEFGPGAPLPINLNQPFWIKSEDSPVGGLPAGKPVQFGIPNLVYDFINGDMNPNSYTNNGTRLFTITPRLGDTNPGAADVPIGLFNHDQFLKFRGDISGVVTPQMLIDQISRVRAPTLYETANYLVPTPNELNQTLGVDSFGSVAGNGQAATNVPGLLRYSANFYAPLYKGKNDQLDIIYDGPGEIVDTIREFMRLQKPALENYTYSLNFAANQTYQNVDKRSAAATGSDAAYEATAKKISDIPDVKNSNPAYLSSTMPQSCGSLSGSFWYFYYGESNFGYLPSGFDTSTCPSTNLLGLLNQYFYAAPNDPNFDPIHYRMEYNRYDENFNNIKGKTQRMYSAYMPGPYNGVGEDGSLVPPSGFPPNQPELMRRNFYSTKLITLDSVQRSGAYNEEGTNFAIYSEGGLTRSDATPDRKQTGFVNALKDDAIDSSIKSIRY